MHYHLDTLGGISGDMFAAAMLDCHPDWEPALLGALALAPMSNELSIEVLDSRDHVFTGKKFKVCETASGDRHAHRHYREIRERLSACALPEGVVSRTVDIFDLLAQAESKVHGVVAEEVVFHEVGAWDSVADIVAAAWLIERAGTATWSSTPLPSGSGTVDTAHGRMPVPAPAAVLLLQGFPLFDDGVAGERITPTGAAILRYLQPEFGARSTPLNLAANGIGFGSRALPGLSNILRVLRYAPADEANEQRVLVCEFEVDDQTPEDLAVGLDKLRETPGVLDVVQAPVFAKKGRMSTHLRLLAEVACRRDVIAACLLQTATLGVRWSIQARTTLQRESRVTHTAGRPVAVKLSRRPDDSVTVKAEMDDIASLPGGFAQRRAARDAAESAAARGRRDREDG